MLKYIKLGDCKIKTIQIEDEWFVSVRHIGIALGVSSVTLKDILRNHLSPQYKFSKKYIYILMTLMMALNYSLQYLVHAGSY